MISITGLTKRDGYTVVENKAGVIELKHKKRGGIAFHCSKQSSGYSEFIQAVEKVFTSVEKKEKASLFFTEKEIVVGIQVGDKGFIQEYVEGFGTCVIYFPNRSVSKTAKKKKI